jgi:amino acid transporter
MYVFPCDSFNASTADVQKVVQELGREGILPFSRLWASNKPFDAPLAGLFEHWLVSVIIMLAPPPGDAYNFILK